jgi:(p)ppGpp synthase/HD superfamily hydrolase
LLAELGCSDVVVTAGVLHDVVEDTAVTREDVAEEFGEPVADLVAELTEDPSIAGYRERKRSLRASVQRAGRAAMLIFAADNLARMRTFDEHGEVLEPASSSTTPALARAPDGNRHPVPASRRAGVASEDAWRVP